MPQYKLDLGGTEYTSGLKSFNVKLRENNYSVATLILDNRQSHFYNSLVDTFTEVKLYVKDATESSYTQVFGGYARDLLPSLEPSPVGEILTLGCKGYGFALEEMHCNRDFGYESSTGTTYDELSEILVHVINNFVERGFDSWDAGHTFNHTLVTDNFDATTFTYINNPYRRCIDVVNHACDLATAIAAGADAENPTAAGPHWIVKPANPQPYFLVGKIGDHAAGGSSPEAQWPDWWGADNDQASSTLTQGDDFKKYLIIDKSEEFANSVVLATDFRRPAYDYWTDDNAATIWTKEAAVTAIAADAGDYIVGSHSLKITWGVAQGDVYYPSTADAAWDITTWGSEKTIPRINFYYKNEDDALVYLALFTQRGVKAFSTDPLFGFDTSGWVHASIPIGPNWAADEENKTFKWTDAGGAGADWSDINGIEFSGIGNGDITYIDDIHLTGKIVRQAYVSDNITSNREHQKLFISRYAMDDSCVASDDSGNAGRLAKAELLRRILNPVSIQFTTGLHSSMLAGQKLYVQAGLLASGSYRIDSAMRAMTVEHGFNILEGAYTRVTATTDLYNTRPISSTDAWALQQEFTLVNSGEAKNMRAGAEIDLLIPMLKKDYT